MDVRLGVALEEIRAQRAEVGSAKREVTAEPTEKAAPRSPVREAEESEAVAAVAERQTEAGRAGMPVGEDDAPWPLSESDEAAFFAESRDRGEPVVVAPPREVPEAAVDNGVLPSADQLVARLSEDVRTTLDDLFRAKFTAVRRVPVKALKQLA